MKILYLNHNFENEGTFNRCFFIGRELVRIGHDVTILTVSINAPQFWFKEKFRDKVRIVTLPSKQRDKDYLFYLIRPFLDIYYVLTKRFDILHAFAVADVLTAFPAVIVKLLKRKTIYVDWDDLYSDEGFCHLRPFPWIMVPWTNLLEKNIPRIAFRMTAVSYFLRSKFIELGNTPSKVFFVPNGCDTEGIKPLDRNKCRMQLGIDLDAKILMYMGRGHHSFYKMVASFIKCDEPNVLLYCVGKFTEEDIQINNMNEKKNIVLTGYINYTQIPYYLGIADILLMPMKNDNIERARWPIRFGDYLASGRTIIANDVGEVGRIIKEYTCGIAVSHIENIGREAIKALTEIDKRNNYELKARNIAEATSVNVVWYHEENRKATVTLPVGKGSRWRTYSSKKLAGLKGNWKVELQDPEGNVLDSVTFTVE